MTKAYYEATLKVILNELKNQKDDPSRLNFIKDKYSCKFFKNDFKILNEENGEGKHFIYSRFKTRGVECISYMLEGFGFKRYTEEDIKELKIMMDEGNVPEQNVLLFGLEILLIRMNFQKFLRVFIIILIIDEVNI